MQSVKYNCITDWNKYKKELPDENQDEPSHFRLKTLLKRPYYYPILKKNARIF